MTPIISGSVLGDPRKIISQVKPQLELCHELGQKVSAADMLSVLAMIEEALPNRKGMLG